MKTYTGNKDLDNTNICLFAKAQNMRPAVYPLEFWKMEISEKEREVCLAYQDMESNHPRSGKGKSPPSEIWRPDGFYDVLSLL